MTTSHPSNTLLNYAITTTPDPLQASPQNGNTVYGALTLVVSNSSNVAVSLESLQVTIPPDLSDDLGAILYNADPQRIWSITSAIPGIFDIEPVSGKPVNMTTQGVVFQFFNIPINTQVGTVQINIIETASSPNNPSDDRQQNIAVTKFPYGFFFSNFTPQVPLVQDDQTVTLTWEGSNQATYAMYYNNTVEDVTNVRKWTSPPLKDDVTFLLRAIVISQEQAVVKDLTTTVVVANPEIRAQSVTVNGLMMAGTGLIDSLKVSHDITCSSLNSESFSFGKGAAGWLIGDEVTVNQQFQTNMMMIGEGYVWSMQTDDNYNLEIRCSGKTLFVFTQEGNLLINGTVQSNNKFAEASPEKK